MDGRPKSTHYCNHQRCTPPQVSLVLHVFEWSSNEIFRRFMPCSNLDHERARQMFTAFSKDERAPEPEAAHHNVDFRVQSYGVVVAQWLRLANAYLSESHEVLSVDEGREAQDSHFGQVEVAGRCSLGLGSRLALKKGPHTKTNPLMWIQTCQRFRLRSSWRIYSAFR